MSIEPTYVRNIVWKEIDCPREYRHLLRIDRKLWMRLLDGEAPLYSVRMEGDKPTEYDSGNCTIMSALCSKANRRG